MERLSTVARHLERAHPARPAPLPASTGESPKHILIVGATGLPSGPPASVVAPWDPIDSQMDSPPATSRDY